MEGLVSPWLVAGVEFRVGVSPWSITGDMRTPASLICAQHGAAGSVHPTCHAYAGRDLHAVSYSTRQHHAALHCTMQHHAVPCSHLLS